MEKYIFDCTEELNLDEEQLKMLAQIGSDLRKIKENEPKIKDIVIRGGFIADFVLGTQPNDIDLFYSLVDESGNLSHNCCCEQLKEIIKNTQLEVLNKYEIDLENSCEKEPLLNPIERTLGIFSYHSDYGAMFCIDENGRIWGNTNSVKYLKERVFEINYSGFIPWAYYKKVYEKFDYFSFPIYVLARGLAHIQRRSLRAGPEFKRLLLQSDYLISKAKSGADFENAKIFARKKLTIEKAKEAILSVLGGESGEVITAFEDLLS